MKKYIFLLSVAVILFASEIALAQKPLYTAPFGVQTYTFRKSFPNGVAATLDSIKQMGFTEIEGGGNKMPAEEFKKLCDERGISIPSTGVGFDQLEKDPQEVATRAKIFGSKFVMCAWIPHDGDFNLDNAKKAIEVFNAAGKVFKENGLIFCYHPHGYEFFPYEKGTLLDYIITNTNPEYVSFEMDILWIQFGGGDPVSLLKKYGKRWKLMHMKDLRKGVKKDLTGGTSQENDVALGTGEINIPAILKEAKKIGIQHYFIEDESSHVNTQVPQSIAYLKSLKQ
ncbi:MAG TPA: TIM barrel protein [Cyclobacteriaceae bacterium]|jgi:sugar phosphate isomerase/epimerase|nr:TIM barrel protein [Cyclobacteriaceae bacterium]